MPDHTLVEALDSARIAHEKAVGEVARLRGELKAAEDHLARLDKVIDAIQDFLEDAAIQKDLDAMPDEVPDEVPDETPDETPDERPRQVPGTFQIDVPVPVRKKYPSTQMVGDLVNELGRPIHRDEVEGAFAERFGIPPTWDNPRNTLGNALLRAWERGAIERLDQNFFAPRGYDGAIPRGGQ